MQNLTQRPEWQALVSHHQEIAQQHMRDLFTADSMRFQDFSLQCGEIFLDYSRNRITKTTIAKLCALAKSLDLAAKMQDLFNGKKLNFTEQRAVLHSALRDKNLKNIMQNGQDLKAQILASKTKLRRFVDEIHGKERCGVTHKPFKTIINVGIGGSHLGPMMATKALKDFAISDLNFHFISSVDKAGLDDVLNQVDPETTLFIISSKTFSTIETLTNMQSIAQWIEKKLSKQAIQQHFVGITANPEKAKTFGIVDEHIFPLWDFIGGRYSIWSAIGLPLMLQLGNEQYDQFLLGAYEMDQHFKTAPFTANMPVLLALLSIWYRNFFASHVQAIIPYSHRLQQFVAYLQQAEMESNGKSIDIWDQEVNYATGPVIFGEEGCNGQHSYHQLLMQGKHLIPVDFILVGAKNSAADDLHHEVLLASGLSQATALMCGKTFEESYAELKPHYDEVSAKKIARHRVIPGNQPNNILFLKSLSPKNLGALIALYEHKIFVQGVIWQINSFDQWGVELGKQLLPAILAQIQGKEVVSQVSTAPLINYLKNEFVKKNQ